MSRKRIPEKIAAEVMFKSNRECVVCDDNKRGDHIHHLDGDNSNNEFDNLALLCFYCHNDAGVTGNLARKLSADTIVKFRDLKYKIIATQRENSLQAFNVPIGNLTKELQTTEDSSFFRNLTMEDLLTNSKNAQIIIELEKIKDEYFSADWNKRADILGQLFKFSDHTNSRLAIDIYKFLSFAADQTRAGMPSNVASEIFSLTLDFFPGSDNDNDNPQIIELAKECVNIAFSIIYDSTIYLKNYYIAMYGLTILKYIYKKGKQRELVKLMEMVKDSYNEIEQTLKRPERDDLGEALELVLIFKSDIEFGTLAFPPLPENLMKQVYKNRKE